MGTKPIGRRHPTAPAPSTAPASAPSTCKCFHRGQCNPFWVTARLPCHAVSSKRCLRMSLIYAEYNSKFIKVVLEETKTIQLTTEFSFSVIPSSVTLKAGVARKEIMFIFLISRMWKKFQWVLYLDADVLSIAFINSVKRDFFRREIKKKSPTWHFH